MPPPAGYTLDDATETTPQVHIAENPVSVRMAETLPMLKKEAAKLKPGNQTKEQSGSKPNTLPAGYKLDDFTTNSKGEGLYRMGSYDFDQGAVTKPEIQVPYSRIEDALTAGYKLHPDEETRYQHDVKYQGQGPTLGEMVKSGFAAMTEPMPDTPLEWNPDKPTLGSFVRSAPAALSNVGKMPFNVVNRTVRGVAGLPGQAVEAVKNVAEGKPEGLEFFDPAAMGENEWKGLQNDADTLGPAAALSNALGDVATMYAAGKATGALENHLGSLYGRIGSRPPRQEPRPEAPPSPPGAQAPPPDGGGGAPPEPPAAPRPPVVPAATQPEPTAPRVGTTYAPRVKTPEAPPAEPVRSGSGADQTPGNQPKPDWFTGDPVPTKPPHDTIYIGPAIKIGKPGKVVRGTPSEVVYQMYADAVKNEASVPWQPQSPEVIAERFNMTAADKAYADSVHFPDGIPENAVYRPGQRPIPHTREFLVARYVDMVRHGVAPETAASEWGLTSEEVAAANAKHFAESADVPRGTPAPEEEAPPETPATPTPEANAPEATTPEAPAPPEQTPAPEAPKPEKGGKGEQTDPYQQVVEHFKPGNVVFSSYWKEYDKVLEFKPQTPDSAWAVKVIHTDKDGNPIAGARPRWHATYPDLQRGDKVVKQGPKQAKPTGKQPPAPALPPAPTPEQQPTAEAPPQPQFKFGNTQAAVPTDSEAYGAFTALQGKVDDADLAGKGKDVDEPHVTVRYGIQSDDVAGITKYLEGLAPFDVKLGKTEIFPPSPSSDGAAVVNVPVESPELHQINDEIQKHGDFTEPSFKEYKPHLTVAYVKPEAANKYKDIADATGKTFLVASVDISDRNGNKTTVQLKGAATAPQPAPAAPLAPPVANSPELEQALRASELHDPSTMRNMNRAIQGGFIPSKEHLDQILQIAKKIKQITPNTPNIAALIEAIEYGGKQGLEAIANQKDHIPVIGKYSVADLRKILAGLPADHPNAENIKQWMQLPDEQLASAIRQEGWDQDGLDDAVRKQKIKLGQPRSPEVVKRATEVLAALNKPDAAPVKPKGRKAKAEKKHEPDSPIDVAFARAAGGKIKIGADPKALAEVLGSSLYGQDPAAVIVKELLQNSWDAIRRSKGAKEVTVVFDRWENVVTVTDTGLGMTRKELETVFTDLGRTGKLSQADASGGFGIAKAAPFMMTKKLTVTTITEENGKFIRNSFISTPDEIVGKGVDITTETLPDSGYTTGTVIEAIMGDDASWYIAQRFASRSQHSLHAPGTLIVKGAGSNEAPVIALPKVPRATITSPGAKATLYASTEETTAGNYEQLTMEVNNNGIYQFDMDVHAPEGILIPKRVAVDIKATVKERDKDYPFMANREGFRSENLKEAIRNAVTKDIFEAAIKKHNQDIADALRGLPAIKVGTFEIPIFDSGKRITPEEMEELRSDPAFVDLAYTINRITRDAVAKLATADMGHTLKGLGSRVRKIGMVFSEKLGGVHITDPQDKQYALLFINPLARLGDDPERAASQIWHVIKHEIIHDKISGHYESFTSTEVEVAAALGSKMEIAAIQELEEVYADPTNPGRIRPDLSRAIQLYASSRTRPETAPDVFRGEGLAVLPGTEAGRGDDRGVRDGGEGTVSGDGSGEVIETPENPNILFNLERSNGDAAPVWYLKSERVIGDKMKGPMQGPDVLRMLRNNGITDEELKWTGLDDYLPTAGRVTPEEVRNFISQNAIQVEEVSKGAAAGGKTRDQWAQEEYDKPYRELTTSQQLYIDHMTDMDDAPESARPKFGSYVQPGGENYRELLLTLPKLGRDRTYERLVSEYQAAENASYDYMEANKASGGEWATDPELAELYERVRSTKSALDNYKKKKDEESPSGVFRPEAHDFTQSHWDEANVLAHVRMNDRTALSYTPEDIARIQMKIEESMPGVKPSSFASGAPAVAVRKGLISPLEAAQYAHAKGYHNDTTGAVRKLLHIEEVQSDWHQKGRKQGYDKKRLAAPTPDEIEIKFVPPTEEQLTTRNANGEIVGPSVYPGYWESFDKRTGELITRHAGRMREEQAREEALFWGKQKAEETPTKVPDAPFKKNWQEMALRRMIRYAAENGYDGISWTGGEGQADRYDLSKQISRIEYEKIPTFHNDRQDTWVINAFDLDGNGVIKKAATSEELPDIIGKELATKIIDSKENEGELSGLDLKVGGEGMKGFYDKIIPDYLNKFGKKFGARVGSTVVNKAGTLTPDEQRVIDKSKRLALEARDAHISWQSAKDKTLDQSERLTGREGQEETSKLLHEEVKAYDAWKVAQKDYDTYSVLNRNTIEKSNKLNSDKDLEKQVQYLPITPAMRDSVIKEGVSLFNLERAGTPTLMRPGAAATRPRSNIVLREVLPGAKDFQERRYQNYADILKAQKEYDAAAARWSELLTKTQMRGNMPLHAIRDLHQEMEATKEKLRTTKREVMRLENERQAINYSVDPNVGEVRLDGNGNPTLYLNNTAMSMIRTIIRPGQYDVMLKGQSMSFGEARWLRNELKRAGPANDDIIKVFPSMMRLLDMAMAKSRTAGITVVGKTGQGVHDAIETLREELIHRWQRMRSQNGHQETHLPDDAFIRLFHDMPRNAYDYLREHGYLGKTAREEVQVYVIEAAAKIMAGKWRKMGLTKPDAVNWLARYYEEVAGHHGVEAVLEVEHTYGVAREFQKELEKRYGPGQPGTAAAPPAQPTDADAGRPLSSLERGGQGEAGGDAAGRAGRGIDSPEQLSLFEPAAHTDSPEFKRWFADSKAVDESGSPLKLYHGTTRKNPKTLRASFEAGLGIFLTDNEDVASTFTHPREYGETVYEDEDGNEIEPGDVVPLYARIENPLVIDESGDGPTAQEVSDDTRVQVQILKQAKADGHDGVILRNVKEGIGERYRGDTYIVFDPKQVKHAERNRGTYDESPNILANIEKMPTGECFRNARKYASKHEDEGALVVHGKVTNATGKTFDHAWVEIGGMVHDPTTGAEMPRDRYYQVVDAKPEAAYTAHEANINMVRSGHQGPWRPDEQYYPSDLKRLDFEEGGGGIASAIDKIPADMTLNDFKQQAFDAGEKYSQEHEKLPVYNRMQWLARQAAIDLGRRRFKQAEQSLVELKENLDQGEDHWKKVAGEYDPTYDANKSPTHPGWEGFHFREFTRQKPLEGATPPERMENGDPILYHGTGPNAVASIMKTGFSSDNLGYVGFGTTPGSVHEVAASKYGKDKRIVQVVLDKGWLDKNADVNNEGSHKNLILLGSPEGGKLAVPREAIKSIRDVTDAYRNGDEIGKPERDQEVKAEIARIADEMGDHYDYDVESGDQFSRVEWEVKRGQDIETNQPGAIGIDSTHKEVRGIHVGDADYWRKRLAKDYDRSARAGKTIAIRAVDGDRAVDDPQYATDPDTGEKADSAVLLTSRKSLKYGTDWVFEGENFADEQAAPRREELPETHPLKVQLRGIWEELATAKGERLDELVAQAENIRGQIDAAEADSR